MKRTRGEKERWEDFEARVGIKRSGGGKKETHKAAPNDILVQRMSSTASGRLKKFEPLDTRDFVPFGEYDDLTIENIKEACEKYYQAPEGSCDILASDRGPSCTKLEQIKGKKVYFIRFLQPKSGIVPKAGQSLFEERFAPPKQVRSAPSPVKKSGNLLALQSTVFPKSVSVTDLLKAGKLVKPPATNMTALDLESFDVTEMKWVRGGSLTLEIEETRFSHGAFRDAFRATAVDKNVAQTKWVVKQYQEKASTAIKDDLGMSLEDHTRKEVQMNAVARHLTKKFAKNVPPEFGRTFEYIKVFFAVFKEQPVTVEEYVEGEFQKYVNNNGMCITSPAEGFDEIYAKAQCLVHFSYHISERKLMLLDIQGSSFKLYDPEIATTDLLANDESPGSKEVNFCAGNLSCVAIDSFKSKHICNIYCEMMSLEQFD